MALNYRYWCYRALEMLPAFNIWVTLIGGIILTFIKPLWVVYFILVFDFYWMVKVIYITTFLIVSFFRYRAVITTNWSQRCAALPEAASIYHLVIIPNSIEHWAVLESTLTALQQTHFAKERLCIVFAAEERYPQSVQNGQRVINQYGKSFGACLLTIHPDGLPNEIKAKGANIAWAGEQAYEQFVKKNHILPANVMVTVLDSDSCVDPYYFDYLTYVYLTTPNRTRASYQPIAMFTNNIWDAPAIMRVASTGTTFWLMAEQVRPERLFTFSSHATPLPALLDVGWWQRDVISEDSRIFLQCFLHYDGDYRVVPLHMPIYMDTVLADSWWKSLKNLYKQQRRWAYGSENIPFMIWHFSQAKAISFKRRFFHIFNQLEGMWSWGTASLLIFIFGYLPLWVLEGGHAGGNSVIAHTAPHILHIMLNIANVGLIISVILGTLILPKRPHHYNVTKYIFMLLQWALLPVSMIVFGTIPAVEAQTRLAFGRYLGFYVTEKARKRS